MRLAGDDNRIAAATYNSGPFQRAGKWLPVPGNSMNCLGRDLRLAGQRRVPEPPERMTGHVAMLADPHDLATHWLKKYLRQDTAGNYK